MLGIKPYIAFPGNCADAVEFYKNKLGAEVLFTQTYGESPMGDKVSDDNKGKVMHTSFKIGDSVIMACDNVFTENPTTVGNNISLALGSNDPAGADKLFDQLAEGGTITMPMQETFWAERFGMLTDKFGINWMFNCEKPHTDQAAA
ncbi:MAG TPA: glyoxalase/bleomycin resistance/extradiol dioxygenase family protein [Pyrinomonadaceae bacterium]|nr:glyoxalase/bleomycin resistance/extradiol dioxygenase family protein [Pyrinomonadaceae bacterium]